MVLYYIVFGKLSISGLAVSVFGFTLTFGAAVFGLLKTGVGAVDHGQYEAACALGYSDRRTFYRIILPQALPHFMPAYKGEITALIKATAVVGYVGAVDITKAFQDQGSNTYEYMIPYLVMALLYIVIVALIASLVKLMERGLAKNERNR